MSLRYRSSPIVGRAVYPHGTTRKRSVLNLFVEVESGGAVGVGECANPTGSDRFIDRAQSELSQLDASGIRRVGLRWIRDRALRQGMSMEVLCGLDCALWDLLAKQAEMPLFKLLGFDKPISPTAIRIEPGVKGFKYSQITSVIENRRVGIVDIYLGPDLSLDEVKAIWVRVLDAVSSHKCELRATLSAGLNQGEIVEFRRWLGKHSCELLTLSFPCHDFRLMDYKGIPVFADPGFRQFSNILHYRGRVDGVVFRLSELGGLTGTLEAVNVARACGLRTMISTARESSIGVACGASIAAAFDYVCLDAHLLTDRDPGEGLKLVAGVVIPSDEFGHGARLVD